MNIQVKTQSHQLDPAINDENVLVLAENYKKLLQQALEVQQEVLQVPAMTLFEKPSKNFQYINMIYKTIVDHQQAETYPQIVEILCQDEATATMYKQVYNFYYPASKADRMEDAGWD